MKKVNYKIIKEYFGVKFIQYIINYNGEINRQTKFEELKLNESQVKVFIYLEDIIKKCRQLCFSQSETEDGSKIVIENPFWVSHSKDSEFEFKDCFKIKIKQIKPLIFNNLRRSCGGDFPQIKTDDSILEFLSNLMIQSYPYLLIKNNQTLSPFPHSISTAIGIETPKILLGQDILNKIIYKENDLNYSFQFKLSNGTQFHRNINSFFETIIWRAFQNSCNQMNYTLESC